MNINFKNDDLEGFLKKNAEEFRLHPSDKVWSGISKHLSRKRRHIGFATGGFIVLALLAGFFIHDAGNNTLDPLSNTAKGKARSIVAATPVTGRDDRNTMVNASINEMQTGITKITKNQNKELNFAETIPAKTSWKKSASFANKDLQPQAQLNTSISETNTSISETESTQPENSSSIEPATSTVLTEQPVAAINESVNVAKVDDEAYPLTIESVTNLYKSGSGKRKLGLQFYFTPTVSYRKLTENKTFWQTQTQIPGSPNLSSIYDVNTAVTHKPDMGVEVGLTTKYAVAKNVELKGGLQFNVNRYDIKAFRHTTELATIAYNNGSRGVSTSNYRNFSGNKVDWLQNLYFQMSVPVGAELKLAGNNKSSVGVAGTLQPTYILGDQAYMISTDYMNYTEVPSLIRKWNVATSFETFVKYSSGKLNWQVGPQVRYQILSNFVSKYPVKEHLFDFGLKVGVSLNKPVKSSEY